jgi:hypothetical protein
MGYPPAEASVSPATIALGLRPLLRQKDAATIGSATPSAVQERSGLEARQIPAPKWARVNVPKITDARGNLTFIEGTRHVPFEIARVYYIYDVPSGSIRAGHAHRKLHQILLALSGSFVVHLDDGQHKEQFFLNRPDTGLYVPPGAWRVLDDFSGGAVMIALASAKYDEADYIRTYEEFVRYLTTN